MKLIETDFILILPSLFAFPFNNTTCFNSFKFQMHFSNLCLRLPRDFAGPWPVYLPKSVKNSGDGKDFKVGVSESSLPSFPARVQCIGGALLLLLPARQPSTGCFYRCGQLH